MLCLLIFHKLLQLPEHQSSRQLRTTFFKLFPPFSPKKSNEKEKDVKKIQMNALKFLLFFFSFLLSSFLFFFISSFLFFSFKHPCLVVLLSFYFYFSEEKSEFSFETYWCDTELAISAKSVQFQLRSELFFQTHFPLRLSNPRLTFCPLNHANWQNISKRKKKL